METQLVTSRPLAFSDLPEEIVVKIFSFLPLPALATAARVSSTLNRISSSDQVWSLICEHSSLVGIKGKPYKEIFKEAIYELPIPMEQRNLVDVFFATLTTCKNYNRLHRVKHIYPELGMIQSRIKIHPLWLLAEVLINPRLAATLVELQKQYKSNPSLDWWLAVKKELISKLKSYSKRNEMDRYLSRFVNHINFYRNRWLNKSDQTLGALKFNKNDLHYFLGDGWPIKLEEVQKIFLENKWEDFFDFCMSKVVNKKTVAKTTSIANANRYEI